MLAYHIVRWLYIFTIAFYSGMNGFEQHIAYICREDSYAINTPTTPFPVILQQYHVHSQYNVSTTNRVVRYMNTFHTIIVQWKCYLVKLSCIDLMICIVDIMIKSMDLGFGSMLNILFNNPPGSYQNMFILSRMGVRSSWKTRPLR